MTPVPEPLSYHRQVVEILREAEPHAWRWMEGVRSDEAAAAALRTSLLQDAYRLDEAAHGPFLQRAAAVAARMGLASRVTLYQSARTIGMNASLCHLPGEAHVVFSGPVLESLSETELDAVLAHELAHHLLWELDGGALQVAERLLQGAADDGSADLGHALTAQRFALYDEIVADRWALHASGSLDAAVSALVKLETGLLHVSAPAYLRQADEILLAAPQDRPAGSHPETFVRARALRLWAEQDASLGPWLASVIEGPLDVGALDLPGRRRVEDLTRRFLAQLLRPAWFRTEATLAHARSFFRDFEPAESEDATLQAGLEAAGDSVRDYLSWVLLDFAVADPDLEDVPLALALQWSERLGAEDVLARRAASELRIPRRVVQRIRREGPELLAKAAGS